MDQAQYKDQCHEHTSIGYARNGQPDAGNSALCNGGHHHAQGHGADRLAGQHHGSFSTNTAEPASEQDCGGSGAFTSRIHDCGDSRCQQEVDEYATKASRQRSKPVGQLSRIGSDQFLNARRVELSPGFSGACSDEWYFRKPGRWRWQPQRKDRPNEVANFVDICDDRAERQPNGYDHNQQQG